MTKQFYQLVVKGNEDDAIKLISNKNTDLDVNAIYNGAHLILLAVNHKMPMLFEAIINHEDFNPRNIDDGFGDTLLTALLYIYGCETTKDDERKFLKKCINSIISSKKFDLNEVTINDETAVHIAALYENLDWVLEKLCAEGVELETFDEFQQTPLMNARLVDNAKGIEILKRYGATK